MIMKGKDGVYIPTYIPLCFGRRNDVIFFIITLITVIFVVVIVMQIAIFKGFESVLIIRWALNRTQ